MIIGSKNKGDWGEFYALVYLLGEQKLHASDVNLNRIPGFYFPILKIMRDEKATSHIDYILDGGTTVEIWENSTLVRTMPAQDFKDEARDLCRDIPLGSGAQFTIPHGETFLNNIKCERLSAPSTDITDIQMEVHDTHTGTDQEIGFSVKSYLGGAPTLLNASGATNFVYEIIGLNVAQMNAINAISTRTKILDRIAAVYSNGATFTFVGTANSTFAGNLMMVDSKMDSILAEMLLYYYTSNVKDCSQVVQYIEGANPLGYPRNGLYEYKFKEFLCAKALGMDPGEPWTGMDDANGGYIVVKSDGDVVAFHLYDRDVFKQYLFDNTHFERGSTSKHGYASIYTDATGRMFMNLNLQIRFK